MSKKKLIYVAGAYSADNVMTVLDNIRKGKEASARLFAMGFYPFCPWSDSDYILHKPKDAHLTVEMFYQYSLAWMEQSSAVIVLPDYENSKGTLKEIQRAETLGIPVFYKERDLIEWYEQEIHK